MINKVNNIHIYTINLGVLQNHRSATSHRPLTTDHRPTNRSSTDPLTTDSPTSAPPTHRQPTTDQPTGAPPLHRSPTYQPTLLQLTNNPLTHQSDFNRVTIGPILSITNFNESFKIGTIYYHILKIICKMIDKKERL